MFCVSLAKPWKISIRTLNNPCIAPVKGPQIYGTPSCGPHCYVGFRWGRADVSAFPNHLHRRQWPCFHMACARQDISGWLETAAMSAHHNLLQRKRTHVL